MSTHALHGVILVATLHAEDRKTRQLEKQRVSLTSQITLGLPASFD